MSADTEDWNMPAENGANGRPQGRDQNRFAVEGSSAAATAELRRAVLRPHFTIDQMAVAGDHHPETAYLAVRAGSGDRRVLGCLRLEPVSCPWPEATLAGHRADWQLRAMATDPAARGTGLGRRLVEAAVEHVVGHGGALIWCNARISAEGFYSGLGFRSVTDPFPLPEVPEQHVGMVREL